MEDLIPLLAPLAVISVLTGPIALIVSFVALNRIKQTWREQEAKSETSRWDEPVAAEPTAEVLPAPTQRPPHIEAIAQCAEGAQAEPAKQMTTAVIVCHLLCRLDSGLDREFRRMATEVLYATGLLSLMAAVSMELWHHGDLNIPKGRGPVFFRQQMVLIATLLAAARLLRRPTPEREPLQGLNVPSGLGLAGILALGVVLTEKISLYFRLSSPSGDWRFLAQMYISITWAAYATGLMVIGFWRQIRLLRYVGLGTFLMLLAKVFLLDTRIVETVHRIAGFMATGIALVAVSYLYQYLKTRGFFDTILTRRSTQAGTDDGVGSA